MSNFLLFHSHYVTPEWILDKPNVCLFFVDDKRAAFCVAKQGENLYDTRLFST